MSGGRVLQIPRAQAEDSGRYTCVAVNEAGEDSIQYDVRVFCEYFAFRTQGKSWETHSCMFPVVYFCPAAVPPTIRGTPSDLPDEVTVLTNKTTQLECHVEGNPAPKITWFKDGRQISADGPHRILSNGRTLQVTHGRR